MVDFAGFLGQALEPVAPGASQTRLVLFGPRVGELRAGLIVHRVLGLRNLAELSKSEPLPGAPAWYGAQWTETGGATWQEIDLARLAQDPAFLQVGL